MATLPSYVLATIGPRQVGGTYRSGYGCTYRVDAILHGPDARAEIFWSDIAIVETDLDGPMAGRRRVHCTDWDPRLDEVVSQPEEVSP